MTKPTVTLSALTIRVIEKGQSISKSNLRLDKFDGATDLLPTIQGYLNSLSTVSELDDGRALCSVEQVDLDGRSLTGMLESGPTGSTHSIKNAATKKRSYTMKVNDAPMIPHFFSFYLPKSKPVGIVLLQRFRQSGIQTLLLDQLQHQFAAENEPYRLHFESLTDGDAVNRMFTEDNLKEIRFAQHQWSPDKADNLDGEAPKKNLGSLVVSFKPKYDGGLIQKLKNLKENEFDPEKLLEIANVELDGFSPNEVSVVMKEGKRKRTISWSNDGFDYRPYIDITDKVEFKDGYPTVESLRSEASSLTEKLSKKLHESPGSQN